MIVKPACMRLIACRTRTRMSLVRHKSTGSSSSGFQLISAVCLERLPIVSPPLNLLERSVRQAFRDYESGRSLYSDHELRHFEDLKRAARMAANEHDEKDIEQASKQTAADFEDASNSELRSFQFAERLSIESDQNNKNRQTLNRCLDRRLVLVTRTKLGERFQWLLPQATVESDETLRQAAERALSRTLGQQDLLDQLRFLSNVPASVYSYRYPKSVTGHVRGAHIFFYKAQLRPNATAIIDAAKLDKNITQDYNWLNRDECQQLMVAERQGRYWSAIDRSLLFEGVDKAFLARVLKRLRSRIATDQQVRETVTVK